MSNLKYYNDSTGQWEYLVIGKQGPTGATGATGATGSDGALSPNYIINGAFDIWQRGTSFTNPSSGTYSADRWLIATAGGVYTGSYSQQSFSSGELEVDGFGQPEYYYRATLTDPQSLSIWSLRQRIEDRATLSGQTATLSFWAKADTSRNINVILANDSAVSGGVTVTTSWARYSVTLNVPTATTVGTSYLELRILFDIAAGATYDIWGVQLEAGSVATPFKRNANSIAGELAACQRYYQTGYSRWQGYIGGTTGIKVNAYLPVAMRTETYTVTGLGSSVSGFTLTGYTVSNRSAVSVELDATATGPNKFWIVTFECEDEL